MTNWKSSVLIAAMLMLAWIAPATDAQSPPTPPNSAKSSPTPDTDVRSRRKAAGGRRENAKAIIASCAAAADDLIATRSLVEALDSENKAIQTRLDTEKRTTAMLLELNETRKSENAALRTAVAAKNETIAAKDAVIAAQDKLVTGLKSKRSSPWKRLGDVLIGVAIAAILK